MSTVSPRYRVFVSYEHSDRELVSPVVQLLRTTHSGVFFDQDSLTPGKLWRGQIDEAIRGAELLIVVWCRHSMESVEVRREWESGILLEKDVMPLLLDATPLVEALAAFQYLDFRAMGGPAHSLTIAREGRLKGLRKRIGEVPLESREAAREAAREESTSRWLVRNMEERRHEIEHAIPGMAAALEAELMRRGLL